MGRKAETLFPFRGAMVSAGDIAAAHGLDRKYAQSVKARLLAGMDAAAAVQDVIERRKEAPGIAGIHPWELDQLRRRLRPGDRLRVRVYYATLGQDTSSTRVETCRVTGVYPHLVTLRRPCGLITSKTYIDLLLEGVRA